MAKKQMVLSPFVIPSLNAPAQSKRKQREPQTRYFVAVAQMDKPVQMDVIRWLLSDLQYECAAILHDKDRNEKGELKNAHVHILLRTPRKLTAKTLSKRFGNYVHFGVCKDPFEYARYLTHSTFNSRDKYQYNRCDIMGNQDFYNEMIHDSGECLRFAETWSGLLAQCNGSLQDAFEMAVKLGYQDLCKSIMSHGYFYEKYFRVHRSVERCIYDSDGEVIRTEVTQEI